MIKRALIALLIAALPVQAQQLQPAGKISAQDYEAMMKQVSNWGRWGQHDELGTLNLITAERRVAAAGLVHTGETVSLSLDMNKERSPMNANPLSHTLKTEKFGGHEIAGDHYAVEYHGFAHSHIDGLPHYARHGKMYNGFSADGLTPDGAKRLGIKNIARVGIFARGVLVDLPAFFGRAYLPPGTAVTAGDLEAWEKQNNVRIGSGDVLLLRTGRWVAQPAPEADSAAITGLHGSVATWLKARDVAVIGSDAISDVMPSGMETLATPLHELVLVGMGMPILDNLDLEALAAISAREKRTTFLFTAAPLRIEGGTGSPLNPLAVF